jgi:hypothetical protein
LWGALTWQKRTYQALLVGFGDASGAIVLIAVDPKVPNGQKIC